MAPGSCTWLIKTDGIVESADILFPELQIASPGLPWETVHLSVCIQTAGCICMTSKIQSRESLCSRSIKTLLTLDIILTSLLAVFSERLESIFQT